MNNTPIIQKGLDQQLFRFIIELTNQEGFKVPSMVLDQFYVEYNLF